MLSSASLSFLVLLSLPLFASPSFVNYRPICFYSKEFTEPSVYTRWSNPKSWPNGLVPGIGNQTMASVTIPCKVGIILDISVTLERLVINGYVKVIDKKRIVVTSHFVVVQGKLTIGTANHPFPGKIIFNLTNSKYTYGWIRIDGEDNAGVKSFAVIGGLVEMNGMYGNQAAWTTLTATAPKGSRSISVLGDVSAWPVGGTIAIASTDYDYRQSETRVITGVTKAGSRTVLKLDSPLNYMHWGRSIATGISGQSISEAAEVALLTRSIVIQGSPEADPTLGGHFVVFQTTQVQKIEGVEFVNMGQRGTHGAYPVYFYLSQGHPNSYVRKVAIHQSKQRCLVIHGTWELTVEENVAYDSFGHCFFLEDGVEFGNTFKNNLAFLTRKGNKYLAGGTNSTQNDNYPASFWISNPNNTLIGNVAAGSFDTGFWFHFSPLVYGASRQFPQSVHIYPKHLALGVFRDNVAHSSGRSGLRTEPQGYRPRAYDISSSKSPLHYPPAPATLKNFRAFKNGFNGMYLSLTDHLVVTNGQFADNRLVGVELRDTESITVKDSVILGETENVGNPTGCSDSSNRYASCEPLSGSCSLPVSTSNARSLGLGTVARSLPIFGVMFTQGSHPSDAYAVKFARGYYPPPNVVTGVTFRLFSNRCKVGAAIAASGDERQRFMPTHSVSSVKFLDSSARVYMAPRALGESTAGSVADAGSQAYFYTFRDLDGSIMGGSGGAVVANTPAILRSGVCKGVQSGKYGWLCPNTCYRQLSFLSSDRTIPIYTVGGNTKSMQGRQAYINLVSGVTEVVTVSPAPEYLTFSYSDPNGCSGGITARFQAPSGYHFIAALVTNTNDCSGSSGSSACAVTRSVICSSTSSSLQVTLGGKSGANVILYRAPGNKDKSCK